jgi:hypothetical protein
MMKYIKKTPSASERVLSVRLSAKIVDALDKLKADVEAKGHKLDVTALVGDAITRQVTKARRDLSGLLTGNVDANQD